MIVRPVIILVFLQQELLEGFEAEGSCWLVSGLREKGWAPDVCWRGWEGDRDVLEVGLSRRFFGLLLFTPLLEPLLDWLGLNWWTGDWLPVDG